MSLGTRAPIMGLVVFCVGQLCAACAQDTPDGLGFALPTSTIGISSDDSEWRSAPAAAFPNMVCAGPAALGTDCCAPPLPLAAVDCQQYPVVCDPSSHLCALGFDVTQAANVYLMAVPEVAAMEGRVWSRVVLQSLTTRVLDLPALPIRSAQLYLAPAGAPGLGGPGTALLGPVSLTETETPVALAPGAQDAFSGFARDYQTPFALWLAVHVAVANGAAPQGTVTFEVGGRAEAVY